MHSLEHRRAEFRELVQQSAAPLYRYCYGQLNDPHLAEDAVQEVFLRAYRHLRDERPENLPAWLFGVARRCCQEMRRKEMRVAHQEQSMAHSHASSQPEHAFSEPLESALESLSDAERSLVYLKHVQGLKCREIAELTGKPLGTLTGTLTRIYHKLRSSMEERGAET